MMPPSAAAIVRVEARSSERPARRNSFVSSHPAITKARNILRPKVVMSKEPKRTRVGYMGQDCIEGLTVPGSRFTGPRSGNLLRDSAQDQPQMSSRAKSRDLGGREAHECCFSRHPPTQVPRL